MMIIVTDNAAAARRDFPNARIIAKTLEVIELWDGTEIAIVRYRSGPIPEDPISCAEILIRSGKLIEKNPERPLG